MSFDLSEHVFDVAVDNGVDTNDDASVTSLVTHLQSKAVVAAAAMVTAAAALPATAMAFLLAKLEAKAAAKAATIAAAVRRERRRRNRRRRRLERLRRRQRQRRSCRRSQRSHRRRRRRRWKDWGGQGEDIDVDVDATVEATNAMVALSLEANSAAESTAASTAAVAAAAAAEVKSAMELAMAMESVAAAAAAAAAAATKNVSGNFDDFSGEKELTGVFRKFFSTRLLLFVAIIVCALAFTSLARQQSVVVRVRVGAGGTDEVTMMKGQCDGGGGGASNENCELTGDACAHVTGAISLATSDDDAAMVTARRAFVTTPVEEGGCTTSFSSELKMATDGHADSVGDVTKTFTVMHGKATGVCWFADDDARSALFSRRFVLGEVALSAFIAQRSTATRVLAAVTVTALMQERNVIGGAGAVTPKGKTVINFWAQPRSVSGSIPAVIGEMTALTDL
jgi:hypothetical protein